MDTRNSNDPTYFTQGGEEPRSDCGLFSFELGATANSRPACYSRQYVIRLEFSGPVSLVLELEVKQACEVGR